jgi:GTPase SAR1 family protein
MGNAMPGRMAKSERRILVVGLDNAGKTSILRGSAQAMMPLRLLSDVMGADYIAPTPTMETLGFRRFNRDWVVNDMSGQGRYRSYWSYWLASSHALIFVVDCLDSARAGAAREELHAMVEQLAKAGKLGAARGEAATGGRKRGGKRKLFPVLIFANKVDGKDHIGATSGQSPGAPRLQDVAAQALQVEMLQAKYAVKIKVQKSNGLTGRGVLEGFQWVDEQLLKFKAVSS